MSAYDFDDDDWKPPSEAELKVIAAKRERSDKISKRMGDYLLKGYKMLATNCRICSTIELQDKQGHLYCVACQEIDSHETSKDDPVLSEHAAEKVIAESAFTTPSILPGSRNPDLIPGGSTYAHPNGSGEGFVDQVATTATATYTTPVPTTPTGCVERTDKIDAGDSNHQASALGATSRPRRRHDSRSKSEQLEVRCAMAEDVMKSSGGGINYGEVVAGATHEDIIRATHNSLLCKLEWANARLVRETQVEKCAALVKLIREIVDTLSTLSTLN